ncbi:MAG TPA: hypothetical protein PK411_14830 [Mesotoga infera]|nr:hypothetical protein [Mesotoga infera]HRR45409.1 hypothetical protein [Mesotoga sp.]HNR79024.1 hypothetical protein [Mesotoga infera]HNS66665.1 hypothetical protein [Mesotoga infera]HOI34952.1 hypothetical protein [Mesotoga infera]HON28782.1 hypothetical protein [Mesotoga infera]
MKIALSGEIRKDRIGCSVVLPPFIDRPDSIMEFPQDSRQEVA